MSVPLTIIVHGGAWYIPPEEWPAHTAGCRTAATAGFEVLSRGGSALDAVETAIVCMEDDPTFDAGLGAHLNQQGVVQLDAGMMDGHTYQVGAVAAIERVRNPIRVARRLLTSEHNRVQLAHSAADFCARLQAPAAAEAAMRLLSDRVGGKGGLILIDHAGRVGYAYNTSQMTRAYMLEGMSEPEVGI